MNRNFRLVKNILVLAVISVGGFFAYRQFFGGEPEPEFILEDSPLHIESIRTIAEISSVSFKDEVVVDTVEYYNNSFNYYDPISWKEQMIDRNIKRRLTLIMKGEVRYGFDLKDRDIHIKHNEDSVWYLLPEPKILDILISPGQTEVYTEKGTWSDGQRKKMERKAIEQMRKDALNLNLDVKSKANIEKLLESLMVESKTIIVEYK